MKQFVYLAEVLLCVALAGCNEEALMKRFVPEGAESTARSYVDLLRDGKLADIEKDLDPNVTDPNIRETLAKMGAIFPSGTPDSVKVVGAHSFQGPEYSRMDITLEYQFSSRWVLANVVTQKKGDIVTLFGFHVDALPDSLERLNRFTLVGKGPVHFLMLMLAIVSLLFSFFTLLVCIRTKNVKWKWLWIVFVLVGVGKCTLNWTTAQIDYQLLAFQIPCFSMTRSLYGPWIVGPYIPLGAILFLNHRWKMKVSGDLVSPRAKPLPPAN